MPHKLSLSHQYESTAIAGPPCSAFTASVTSDSSSCHPRYTLLGRLSLCAVFHAFVSYREETAETHT